jgi:hypothetical protein
VSRRPLDLDRGRPASSSLAPAKNDNSQVDTPWEIPHPTFRGECEGGPRPCPLVGCCYNTYLVVKHNGNITLTHPDRLPEDVPPDESCVLDVADQGYHTLDEVGRILGLTRERIRQIETSAVDKIQSAVGPSALGHR